MKFPPPILGAVSVAALLLVQPSAYAQDDNPGKLTELKAQIQEMQEGQKESDSRLAKMQAKLDALQTRAHSGSILNTHVLTDADGKAVEGQAAALDENFLKTLTHDFTFSAYLRAGFLFNGNGGGGNFNFGPPDDASAEATRARLGNENDTYMEISWIQSHMLGHSPDVMDVQMTFTPMIRYVQNRNTFTGNILGNNAERSGNDFDFTMRQIMLDISNVFKAAPEITFWAGQRMYDRFQVEPMDYYLLSTSGFGAGVYNVDLGFGKLWAAWIGGLNAADLSPNIGTHFRHTFDVRIKDIDIGFGKIMPILVGNFEKGGTFTQDYNQGSIVSLTNPLHADSAWGIGGGFVYDLNFAAGGSANHLQVWALFARGATNFGNGNTDLGLLTGAEAYQLFKHPGILPGQTVNVGSVINKARTFRAGFQYYWYPVPFFSLSAWGFWDLGNAGSFVAGTNAAGKTIIASGNRNIVYFGIRPCFWITDNIAIQGQAFGTYLDNNRNSFGTNAFGKGGKMGVFTIAPTIKPKGGYFTRPELRVFATYAIWSDSLRGATTPSQQSGNDYKPPYNGNTNQGWLLGTQIEWFY
jgi:maltoporin